MFSLVMFIVAIRKNKLGNQKALAANHGAPVTREATVQDVKGREDTVSRAASGPDVGSSTGQRSAAKRFSGRGRDGGGTCRLKELN